MISISTIRTYMFCPLKLYFQKNLDEEIKENFTVSKTIKELRVDIQDIIQRNIEDCRRIPQLFRDSLYEIFKIIFTSGIL